MNYIKRLQAENDALKARLDTALTEVTDLQKYYTSEKFQKHDHAFVSTDVLPRLAHLKTLFWN